jgi:hypothetical protein
VALASRVLVVPSGESPSPTGACRLTLPVGTGGAVCSMSDCPLVPI